ncbi:MAG: PAS domain-containing protein, partial [Chloroflexi bacterium]|nr:PAS domain-containing protein [Chloroflexota bacterium]
VKNHDQQELAKTLVRFRQAARAHPDGVVSLDADNRIDWCNDVAEHHFDLNLDADRGHPHPHACGIGRVRQDGVQAHATGARRPVPA